MKQEFTIEEALKIQEEHISQWAVVLNPEAYVRLIEKVLERNRRGYKYAHNVARGTTLDQYVADVTREMIEEKTNKL
jgi:hypothetical protein